MSLSKRNFLKFSATGMVTVSSPILTFPLLANAGYKQELEYKIEKAVKNMRRRGVISGSERSSWSIFDFTGDNKLVSINEDKPMQAASMIKPFIAQAFFIQHAANPGRYPYTTNEKVLLERMLRYSNNHATNTMINIVGKRSQKAYRPVAVEKILKQHSPGLFRQTSIVEYIPPGGRTYRNSASAHDYSRFLYALWNGSLPFSDELKHYMALSNKDRITTRVPSIPSSVKVYDKTGSTSRMCGNMGIVVAKDRQGNRYPYTFIGMIERDQRSRSYTSWIRSRSNALREISAITYNHIKSVHNLS